jgi:hypothetical protein
MTFQPFISAAFWERAVRMLQRYEMNFESRSLLCVLKFKKSHSSVHPLSKCPTDRHAVADR